MTGRASKVLGWRKTESRRVHKFGIFKKALTLDGTTAVPMVMQNRSRENENALIRASLGRAIGVILLKRAQMSQ